MFLEKQMLEARKRLLEAAQTVKAAGADVTDEQAQALDEAEAAYSKAQALFERAQKSSRLIDSLSDQTEADETPNSGVEAKTLGGAFAKALTAKAPRSGERFTVTATYKAQDEPHKLSEALSGALGDKPSRLVEGYRPRLVIADLLGEGTSEGNSFAYFVEEPNALEGDYAFVNEGDPKPQVHFKDPQLIRDSYHKLAAWYSISDEMIEDAPFMKSFFDSQMLYRLALKEEKALLAGDGAAGGFKGLLKREGIQKVTSENADGNPDAIFKAITSVQTATGFSADGIVINPADYQAIRLMRDANKQYYGGGFFEGAYGQGTIVSNPPLWGLPTVVTTAVDKGTALVGAFKIAGQVFRKGGVRAEATNSHGEDFTHNRITCRVEERIGLAVPVPAAIVQVTLGA